MLPPAHQQPMRCWLASAPPNNAMPTWPQKSSGIWRRRSRHHLRNGPASRPAQHNLRLLLRPIPFCIIGYDETVLLGYRDSGMPDSEANANPASLDYLIPTKVSIPSASDAEVIYPAGQLFTPKFLPDAISVYEGSATVKIRLPLSSITKVRSTPLSLEVQACDRQTCLPPSTIALPIGQ